MIKLGWRVWILIFALIFSILAIRPSFQTGVMIKSVDQGSLAFEQGVQSGEIITQLNGQTITTIEGYSSRIAELLPRNESIRIDLSTSKNKYVFYTNNSLGIAVQKLPHTRLKTGLDIQGGARALVKPAEDITDSQLQDLIAVSSNRFNVFGLSDVQIRAVKDLNGNKFMLIEIAGATPNDLEDLVAKQGKFSAIIGNQTVFVGGDRDITSVCRNDASCAAVTGCYPSQSGQYSCTFAFTIYLSEEAAKRHAKITDALPVDYLSGGRYLSSNLTLTLDDKVVDQLLISRDLKGKATTQISIQGSGQGKTQQDAVADAKANMHRLQTVLITGSLPYKLEIVKLDTISPFLGSEFISRLLLTGLFALLAVCILVFIRYRRIKESLAVLVTSFSEIIIILGVAALIKWNLDLPSIAGILATIGTGVDQQIVILDEARRDKFSSMKEKMKRAIFIVFSAFATSAVSLLPLYWAGAGLFKGFALTTLIGITAGVLISRPAFAEMIRRIEEN